MKLIMTTGTIQFVLFVLLIKISIQSVYGISDEDGPLQIGTNIPINISSMANSDIKPVIIENPDNDGIKKTYTIFHEDATYISVHFSEFDLDSDDCWIKLRDTSGEQEITMDGSGGRSSLGTFWAPHINGDTMIIIFHCSDKSKKANFAIDEYVAGYVDINGGEDRRRNLRGDIFSVARDLKVCNTDDVRNAQCYKNNFPTQYQKAKAVARIIIHGSGMCTGWLVGPNNVLITNKHCIRFESQALDADYEFMYESSSGSCNNPHYHDFVSGRQVYDAVELLDVSYSDDYSLIKLAGDPVSKYGYLDLDNRLPQKGETIYIPQHPGGYDKAIGIYDTSTNSGKCQVKSTSARCGSSSDYGEVEYTCDTKSGSSGSPVISERTHKVIALHHCGGSYDCGGNVGVPIKEIYGKISQYVYGPNSSPGPPPPPPVTPPPPTDAPRRPTDSPVAATPVTPPPTKKKKNKIKKTKKPKVKKTKKPKVKKNKNKSTDSPVPRPTDAPTISEPKPVSATNYCGVSFSAANNSCNLLCPLGIDAECPSGQKCFAGTTCP